MQLQEAKAREESSVLDYTKELQVKNDEIKELKEANKKFETENEVERISSLITTAFVILSCG